jgi:hypothetical protein
VVDANKLGAHAGSSDARPTPWSPGPRRATGETDPRGGAPADLRRRRTCHGYCLAHPGPGTPRGGKDTPKAREIGYSAASLRGCVWWRHCGLRRGRSDRRDSRWSARGDHRRHRRCCPWRYWRQEDCRGCAAWRPAPGEAVHQRRRIAGAPKPTRLTPTRDPGTGHLPSGWRCTAAMGSCRTFGGARPSSSIGNGPRLRTGRSALLGGWDAHRATGGRSVSATEYRMPAPRSRRAPPRTRRPGWMPHAFWECGPDRGPQAPRPTPAEDEPRPESGAANTAITEGVSLGLSTLRRRYLHRSGVPCMVKRAL